MLLVNEQQSTQQAKAVRSGKAAYDILTLAELQQQQEQQQRQQERLPPQLQPQQQQLPLQAQQPPQPQLPRQQRRQADPGRDAYAAALILSRYYNGLVQPTLVAPDSH